MRALVLVAASLAACGTKSEPTEQPSEQKPTSSPPATTPPPLDAWSPPDRSPPLPKPTSPIRTPDELVAYAFQTHGLYPIGLVTLGGIRPDGTFDPTLGNAKITTSLPDYAEHKIGMICPIYTWQRGELTVDDTNCIGSGALSPPRCTIVEVWKRARAERVPTNGTAALELDAAPNGSASQQLWRLMVRSTKGDLTADTIADDCRAP